MFTDSKDQLKARASQLNDSNQKKQVGNDNIEDDISTGLANMTIDNLFDNRTVGSSTSILSKYSSSKTVQGGNLKSNKGKVLIRLPHRVHVWRDNLLRIRVSVIIQLLSGVNARDFSFGLDNKSNPKSSIFKMVIPYSEMFTDETFSLFHFIYEVDPNLKNNPDLQDQMRLALDLHPRTIRFKHDVATFRPDYDSDYTEEFHIDLGVKCSTEYVTAEEDPLFNGARIDQAADGSKYFKLEYKAYEKDQTGDFMMSPVTGLHTPIRSPILENKQHPPGEISINNSSVTKNMTPLRTTFDEDHDTEDNWAKNNPDNDADDSSTIKSSATLLSSFSAKHKAKKPRMGSSHSMTGLRTTGTPNRPSPTNYSTNAMSRVAANNKKRGPLDAYGMLQKAHQNQKKY